MQFIKQRLVWVCLLVLAAGIVGYGGLAAAGAAGDPGSASDPLVTRSFVEKYVQDFMSEAGPAGGGSLEWSVTELAEGQEFIGKSGTEFIVRSGSAVVVDPSGGGIPDLTAGENVLAGQKAANNHLFTIPRSDGRGIRAQKQTTIMYRGF